MKKYFLMMFCLCCSLVIMTSCDDDDSVEDISFVKGELYQTTWSGQQVIYDNQGNVKEVDHFYLEFQKEPTAYYIQTDEEYIQRRFFKYKIEGKMLYAANGVIFGNWTILEKTKNKMTMQAFKPVKCLVVLNRIN